MKKGCLVFVLFWGFLIFGGLIMALLGFAMWLLELCFPILVVVAAIYGIMRLIDYLSNRYSPKKQQRPHNGGHRGSNKKKSKQKYDFE